MNTNPIICDPDSEEAKALIGQECEFSDFYYLLKNGQFEKKGIVGKIDRNRMCPFYLKNGNGYTFIRKAAEKLSDRLGEWLSIASKFSYDFNLIGEAIEKLRELGE